MTRQRPAGSHRPTIPPPISRERLQSSKRRLVRLRHAIRSAARAGGLHARTEPGRQAPRATGKRRDPELARRRRFGDLARVLPARRIPAHWLRGVHGDGAALADRQGIEPRASILAGNGEMQSRLPLPLWERVGVRGATEMAVTVLSSRPLHQRGLSAFTAAPATPISRSRMSFGTPSPSCRNPLCAAPGPLRARTAPIATGLLPLLAESEAPFRSEPAPNAAAAAYHFSAVAYCRMAWYAFRMPIERPQSIAPAPNDQ